MVAKFHTGILDSAQGDSSDDAAREDDSHVLSINGGQRRLRVRGGRSLLATLAAEGLFLASTCGGQASCGCCRCRVTSEIGALLPAERPHFSPVEIEERYRLACQVPVDRDLEISIPEAVFSVGKYAARVERIRDLTYDIKEYRLDLGGKRIDFRPGQYVQLVIPPYDRVPESVQRAYSLSSRPSDAGHAEILVRLVPGGIASTWMHSALRPGDDAELVGPFGDFGIRPTSAPMLWVAGGSGMAPFLSILGHMEESGAWADREIWLFFGARSTRDLFYVDELAELSRRLPAFHFIAALSEPRPEDAWTGAVGLITEVLDRHLRGSVAGGRDLEGYLCGSPGMVNACIKVMVRNGLEADNIYYDKFS